MKVTFDELKTLFETDPNAAEIKVSKIIEDYISTLSPERQQRARAFNWRIQQDLRKFKDPQARMNRMVELFWKGVKEFQQVMQNPEEVLNQRKHTSILNFNNH